MEVDSFSGLIESLQKRSGSRDPRLVRLSSVVSAITDVIRREGLEVTPPRVYAKTVVTLEGSIQRDHQGIDQLVDSMYTQVALLELLHSVLPLLETSTISATFAPTARALRNLLDFLTSLGGDVALDMKFNTKDDVGSLPSVLCAICKSSSMLFRCISKVAEDMDEKLVRQSFRATLGLLLNNKSERVRTSAKKHIGGLLQMEDPKCHAVILKDINGHIISSLDVISSAENPSQRCGEMMGIFDITRSNIMQLDFASIGEKLMYVLVGLFDKLSPLDNDFVLKTKDSTSVVLVVNILLSAVLQMLESGTTSKIVDQYAGRVLATLLQVRPNLILRGADLETSSAGCDLFAQLMLAATRRLMKDDYTKAAMLLPLTVNQLFAVATENEKLDPDSPKAEGWFLDLVQILLAELPAMRIKDPVVHAKCSESCLNAVKPILALKHRWVYQGPLMCLAELLLQADTQVESATNTIKTLISLREKAETGSHASLALDKAIFRTVQGYGIDKFWHTVDFPRLCFSDKSPNGYAWLVKIMRQAGPSIDTPSVSLHFFQDQVIPLARRFDVLATESQKDNIVRKHQALELWSLFPSVCTEPNDLVTSLPNLAPVLVRAMKDKKYPQLVISISAGISLLAIGVTERLAKAAELAEETSYASYRSEAKIMTSFSEKLLPTLFKMVDDLYCSQQQDHCLELVEPSSSGGDIMSSQADALTDAITSLAKLASPALLQSLFTKVIHRLLEASQSQEDMSDKMCSLLALSQALYTSQCLNESSVVLLYRALRPLIGTDETRPRVQKRSYKLLAELCKSKSFVMSDGRLNELVELLTSSTATSQVAARSMRLRCLETITSSLRGSAQMEQWVLSSLLGEVLLCLKDSNKRTREASSTLLISVSRDCIDTCVLIRAITGCLAAETSHMRSAAVTALSKLVHEHGKVEQSVQNLLPSLLQTILLLSDDPSREVIKSMIVFVRVAVAVSPPDMMKPLLPSILDGLLQYHRGKDRFRGKIKIVMKKLIRAFGYDHIIPLVTETESQILLYLKKLAKTDEKKKKTKRDQGKAKMKSVDEMMASDEEETDDEDDASQVMMTAASGKRRRVGRENLAQGGNASEKRGQILIRNDTNGSKLEVQDLADRVSRNVQHSDESDSDDGITFDERGRLVITEDAMEIENNVTDSKKNISGTKEAEGSAAKPSNRHNGREQKGKKLGEAYKSRKAGGDVKKKGQKFDPYAYVPLDGRSYTKKNRRNAVEKLDSVVRGKKRQKK